jgi:hypothetical protein
MWRTCRSLRNHNRQLGGTVATTGRGRVTARRALRGVIATGVVAAVAIPISIFGRSPDKAGALSNVAPTAEVGGTIGGVPVVGPGGVAGANAWFRGDYGYSAGVWQNMADPTNDTRAPDGVPTLAAPSAATNWNPAINMVRSSHQWLETLNAVNTTKYTAPGPATIGSSAVYAVGNHTGYQAHHWQDLAAIGPRDGSGDYNDWAVLHADWINQGNRRVGDGEPCVSPECWARTGAPGGTYANTDIWTREGVNANNTASNGVNDVEWASTVTGQSEVWGMEFTPDVVNDMEMKLNGSTGVLGGNRFVPSRPAGAMAGADKVLGIGGSLYQPENWDGNVTEVVHFPNRLDAASAQKVESYLALRSGVTLRSAAGAGTYQYVLSDGSVVWDGAANATYHNDVFGIATDYAAALQQNKSTSQSYQLLTVEASAAPADTTGIMFGNNATTGTTPYTSSVLSPTSGRQLNRVWKVSNPDGIASNFTVSHTGMEAFLYDSTCDGSFETELAMPTGSVSAPLADGSCFTFGSSSFAPGGVSDGLRAWQRADRGTLASGSPVAAGGKVAQWVDQGPAGADALPNRRFNNTDVPQAGGCDATLDATACDASLYYTLPVLQAGSTTTNSNFNPYLDFLRSDGNTGASLATRIAVNNTMSVATAEPITMFGVATGYGDPDAGGRAGANWADFMNVEANLDPNWFVIHNENDASGTCGGETQDITTTPACGRRHLGGRRVRLQLRRFRVQRVGPHGCVGPAIQPWD